MGTLILDCQGFSRYLEQDRAVMGLLEATVERGAGRVVSAATLLESQHDRIKQARLSFVLAQMRIEPLSVDWAKEAAALLRREGMSGHKYAIDAMVAVTALHQPGPVVMLTSDVDDMSRLCGDRVTLVPC